MVPLTLGIIIAFIAIAMAKDLQLPPRTFALSLLALPAVYMVFALSVGDMHAFGLELAYGLPYFVSGYVCFTRGFKGSGILVVALWMGHAVYDIYHHVLVTNAGMPGWYPAFCLGFDLIMVVYLSRLVMRQKQFDIYGPGKI